MLFTRLPASRERSVSPVASTTTSLNVVAAVDSAKSAVAVPPSVTVTTSGDDSLYPTRCATSDTGPARTPLIRYVPLSRDNVPWVEPSTRICTSEIGVCVAASVMVPVIAP